VFQLLCTLRSISTLVQYDANSAGPAPPTAVLVMNLSPLTPNQSIRRHFSTYGRILSFEPQINGATGAALGIVLVRFNSHEEAKKCVEKEHGKKGATGIGNSLAIVEDEELKVVFDGEGKKLAAVMKELEARRRRERDEKRRAEEEKKRQEERKKREASASMHTPSTSAGHTPASSAPWRPSSHPSMLQAESMRSSHAHYGHSANSPASYAHYRLNGTASGSHSLPRTPLPPSAQLNGLPGSAPNDSSAHGPARIRRPAQYSRNRDDSVRDGSSYSRGYASRAPLPASQSSSGPVRGRRPHWRDRDRDDDSLPPSRSPSPIRRRGGFSRTAKQREHEAVVEDLAKNGYEYVTLEGRGSELSGAVREEDVKKFFTSFDVDKVCFPSWL
jgi:RNA recognition motif-containing protein